MLAGAKFRGEFEERLKGVLKDIEQGGSRIILFIDEIHVMVGAGASEGAIDASNILKPPLARGQLRCLGATTTEEYRKYIEKDGALARRFQPIFVNEPTVDETIDFLKGIRSKYEIHHGVCIGDDALVSAAKLSSRYITDRRLPDKAIDLLDEGASRLRMSHESKPKKILVMEKKIADLKCRIEKLRIENISKSKTTHESDILELQKQIDDISAQKDSSLGEWQALLSTLGRINEVRIHVESLKNELQHLQRDENHNINYERASSIRASIDEGNEKMKHLYSTITTSEFNASVTSNNIAEIISKNTGIPVGNLLEGERQSLLSMEETLSKQVVGQSSAISAISKCIRLSRAGLRYHDRPLGCFLLLGPTGVGKTELAKALSRYLFQDENAMFRIDMSEYMEKHNVSSLVGSPKGYVGYEEGGILTNAIRRRPYQLILLDEFEKSHRDVSNLLLQVFDEGRLSDAQGRVVDFRNTVILMTSNLGQSDIYKSSHVGEGEGSESGIIKSDEMTKAIVSQYFSPEFINRLDEVLTFNKLDVSATKEICRIQLNKVRSLLRDRGLTLEVANECEEWLVTTGYSEEYGARPLKRLIQSSIMQPLSCLLIEGKLPPGSVIHISTKKTDAGEVELCLSPRT